MNPISSIQLKNSPKYILSIDPGTVNFGLALVQAETRTVLQSATLDLTLGCGERQMKRLFKKHFQNVLFRRAWNGMLKFIEEAGISPTTQWEVAILIEKTSFYIELYAALGACASMAYVVHYIDPRRVCFWSKLPKGKDQRANKKLKTPKRVLKLLKLGYTESYKPTDHEWDAMLNACYFLKNPLLFPQCPISWCELPLKQQQSSPQLPLVIAPMSNSSVTMSQD